MKAMRVAGLSGWILMAAGLVFAAFGGFDHLGAEQLSGDRFAERYELPRDPKTALEDILARDEFRNREESWIAQARTFMWETFLRAVKWILDRLPRFGTFDLDEGTGQMILDAQLIGLLALIAGLCAWLVVRLIAARRRGMLPVDPHEDRATSETAGNGDERAAALKLAERGRYGEALIHLFRYVLIRLDEKGRVSVGPGKTNREVLESIPVDEPFREPMAEMIPLFNRVRYGGADCGKADYERFEALSRTAVERT
ncbi:MAG: DUF4129 domain-containing protein [Desulfomonilaceae bacterium]|nr:DUF4129 domain-containing protein [Desulfomonilaceae bacterium]